MKNKSLTFIKLITILTLFTITIINFKTDQAFAYPPLLKQAQQLGFEAKDCAFCHEKPSGNKGWNKRGLWLKQQKKERKASVVDVKWLKNYNPEMAENSKPEENKSENGKK